MNRTDLVAILREILESPPGERPRLLNAILSEREKSRIGQVSEMQSDPFVEWFRQSLRESSGKTSSSMDSDDILELIQKALGNSQVPSNFEGSNAFRNVKNEDRLPNDSEIRGQLRQVFERIDRESRLE